MKIAVIGTYSTGKTTLAETISERFNIPYVRGDKARDIAAEFFPGKSLEKFTYDEQWSMQNKMLDSLTETQLTPGQLVTDGCTLTCLPYGDLLCGQRIRNEPGYSAFEKQVRMAADEITHLIYIPPELGLENDALRPASQNFRLEIDTKLLVTLKDFNFRTVTGTVEQRVEQVGRIAGIQDSPWRNYIAFEGLPRCGKTTQLQILKSHAEQFGAAYYQCARFDSPYAKDLYKLKSENPRIASKEAIELHAEALLYDFNNNHVEERIHKREIVIADRQKHTALALYGALGAPLHEIYRATYKVPTPGRVIYLKVSPRTSVERMKISPDGSALKHDLMLQSRVENLYEWLIPQFGFEIIDGERPAEVINNLLLEKIFGGRSHE